MGWVVGVVRSRDAKGANPREVCRRGEKAREEVSRYLGAKLQQGGSLSKI